MALNVIKTPLMPHISMHDFKAIFQMVTKITNTDNEGMQTLEQSQCHYVPASVFVKTQNRKQRYELFRKFKKEIL